MAEKYTLTQGAAQWLVDKLKGSAQKQDVLTYEEIQASTDLSGKIASASAMKSYLDTSFVMRGAIDSTEITVSTLCDLKNGTYQVISVTGLPFKWGVLIVLNSSIDYGSSIFIGTDGKFSFNIYRLYDQYSYTNGWKIIE